jgi:hypothetical protein
LDWGRCYDLRVTPELPVAQHFRNIFKRAVLFFLPVFCVVFRAGAETQKPSLPDPIKFINKYNTVANVVHDVLSDMGFDIELDDRKEGKIMTSGEVNKVAIKNDTFTGTWLKARYSVEALIEIVSPTETMVTIHTKMEGLNRDVDGTEKWLPLESLGTFERRILGRISTVLLHTDAPAQEKKGFWGKSPQPVDPRQPRFPTPPSR